MKKKNVLILSFLLAVPFVSSIANTNQSHVVNALENKTYAGGAGYYAGGKVGNVTGGWPVTMYTYSSDIGLQLLLAATEGTWGDYAVTQATVKLDVSQEIGTHKVLTLVGSQSGFRLYGEDEKLIYERYGDATGSRVNSDTNASDKFFWNRSDYNIECRLPYALLVGENYDYTKSYPTIGVAFQTFYANGENWEWANNSKYSSEFKTLNDPSTYKRITFDESAGEKANYVNLTDAKYNKYSLSSIVTINNEKTTLQYGSEYNLTIPTAPEGKIFDSFNTKEDGTGKKFLASGVYDGCLEENVTLYPIYKTKSCTIKFVVNGEEISSETMDYGNDITIPTSPTAPEDKFFAGWYYNDTLLKGGDTVKEDATYTAVFKNIYTISFDGNEVKVKEGSVIEAPKIESSKEGYVFDGWYDGDVKLKDTDVATKNASYVSKFKFNNKTYVGGDGYYDGGKIGNVTGGWPVTLYAYSSDIGLQLFAYATEGTWGDYAVTSITIKLDVSQEEGTHKVLTLVGSQSGFRLYGEDEELIYERYGDISGSRVNSDTNASDKFFWNRSDYNIECRLPYALLVGENYDYAKSYPTIGVAFQTYHANGEQWEWANNSKYSSEFKTLNDPSTYKRVTFDISQGETNNYVRMFDSFYNVMATKTNVTIDYNYENAPESTKTIFNINEEIKLDAPSNREHYKFKEYNSKADGSGQTISGIYDGSLGKEATIYAIWEVQHEFVLEVVEDKYLCSEASCTEPATYYKSCACGEASKTETFKHGEAKGHNWHSEVTKQPTKDEEGNEHLTCETCGAEEDRSIPKLDNSEIPSEEPSVVPSSSEQPTSSGNDKPNEGKKGCKGESSISLVMLLSLVSVLLLKKKANR